MFKVHTYKNAFWKVLEGKNCLADRGIFVFLTIVLGIKKALNNEILLLLYLYTFTFFNEILQKVMVTIHFY